MWSWSLNWGRVSPEMLIGSCPMTPADLSRIQSGTGVSAILSLQHDACLAFWGIDEERMRQAGKGLGLRMERCPIRDFDLADMRRQLPAAVSLLGDMIAQGHRVYVHCTAGMGRAPLTVLGYLVMVRRLPRETAIKLILAGRPVAVPAWEALEGCVADLTARHREAIEHRAHELHGQGVNNNRDEDWEQAQTEILRSVLLPGG